MMSLIKDAMHFHVDVHALFIEFYQFTETLLRNGYRPRDKNTKNGLVYTLKTIHDILQGVLDEACVLYEKALKLLTQDDERGGGRNTECGGRARRSKSKRGSGDTG